MSETIEVEICTHAGPDCPQCGTPDAAMIMRLSEPTPMENVARYAELTARKRELAANLALVQAELDALEPGLLDWYAENGTQSIKSAGGTVYLHRQLWARPKDGEWDNAITALIVSGLADLVQRRFNLNTLSAWVREREAAGEALPESFEGAIDVTEDYSLRVRR